MLLKKLISPQDKENRYRAAGTLYGAKTSLLYTNYGNRCSSPTINSLESWIKKPD